MSDQPNRSDKNESDDHPVYPAHQPHPGGDPEAAKRLRRKCDALRRRPDEGGWIGSGYTVRPDRPAWP